MFCQNFCGFCQTIELGAPIVLKVVIINGSYKKLNVIQNSSGVDLTLEALGLIAYSSINKSKGHMMPFKEKLAFRGIVFDEEQFSFMDIKKLLAQHEVERVKESGFDTDTAKKAFQQLWNTIFIGVDIDQGPADFVLAEDLDIN